MDSSHGYSSHEPDAEVRGADDCTIQKDTCGGKQQNLV